MEYWELQQRQSLPLDAKVLHAQRKIEDWYNFWDGNVYVSFSGGKDSTVLLDIVRKMHGEVPAVFCNTGLEYPEIYEFVKSIPNVVWLRPKHSFKWIVDNVGYPVMSKDISNAIEHFKTTKSEEQRIYRLKGGSFGDGRKKHAGVIPQCYQYLLHSPFKISKKCCDLMKKKPSKQYEKETDRHPYIGTMASDSKARERNYLKTGCNAFNNARPISMPMSIWYESDVWDYIHKYNVPYSKIYDMGERRTGCIFCMFGVHLEEQPNRFQRMQKTHPKLYEYCMGKLGLKEVLQYIKVPYEVKGKQMTFETEGQKEIISTASDDILKEIIDIQETTECKECGSITDEDDEEDEEETVETLE